MRVGTAAGPWHCERSEIRYPQCFRNMYTAHRTWALNKHICTFTCFPGGLEEVFEPVPELVAPIRVNFS